MDTKELTNIARTFSDAIITQGITKAELVMLNALIQQMTMGKIETTPEAVLETKAETPKPPPSPVIKQDKSIEYDDNPDSPTYDPTPAIEVDKVPPRAVATGKIIATEGEACICKKCGKIVYTVIKDIPDNCQAAEFFESFAPYGKAPAMPDNIQISNSEGSISMDCPMCKDRKKSLFLVGGNVSNAGSGDIISV